MLRPLIVSLLAGGLATGAVAQSPGGPSIAYVKSVSNGHEIYLVDADGSGLTRVYKGASKVAIQWIDLKPGGNEIAFSENWRIKIQKFHANGQPNGAATPLTTPSGCQAWHPDYHPSGDGSLVFIVACSGQFAIWSYTPGSAPAPLFSTISTNRVRWSQTGTHLYYDEESVFNSGDMRLRRRDMANGQAADFGPLTDLSSFDVARTGDRLAFGSPLAPKLIDFASDTSTTGTAALCVTGSTFHFSPDDTQFIYQTPPAKGGTFIMVEGSNCVGGRNALTGKGSWGQSDWRPNPVTP